MANIVKLTEEELKTTKLKNIITVVKNELTADEIEQMKAVGTDEEKRRVFVTEMYNKYIDTVIAKAKEETIVSTETGTDASSETKTNDEPTVVTQTSAEIAAEPVIETKGDVNTDVSFSVDIRGVSGHNGSFVYTCERLLVLAFRNPAAAIKFRTKARAQEFICIVKNVSNVKGIFNLSEADRARVVEKIKLVNEL